MRVKELMSIDPVTVPSNLAVGEAEQLAVKRGVRHLLVTQNDRLAGVLCLCDLREQDLSAPVSRVMSTPFFSVGENAPVERAAQVMNTFAIGCLPVFDGSTLTGILTRGDLWRSGVARKDLGGLLCASCQTHMHVRPDRRIPDEVSFCVECQQRARPASPDGEDDDEDSGVCD